MFDKLLKLFYYSNIFLGLCAVLLAIETNLATTGETISLPFYLVIFLCTGIYYTMIYIRSTGARNYNERTLWYRQNIKILKSSLLVSIILLTVFFFYLFFSYLKNVERLSITQLLILAVFPAAACLYTFSPKFLPFDKIRQIGWLKPFIIGFSWAGLVTVAPIIFMQISKGNLYRINYTIAFLIWLQNFLFISAIAIIFDLKDYRTDTLKNLKTYPVTLGIRKSIFYVILPMMTVTLFVFFIYDYVEDFTLIQTILRLIPYILLTAVIFKYKQQRRLLYYLAIVDGLLFVKAICSIASIVLKN